MATQRMSNDQNEQSSGGGGKDKKHEQRMYFRFGAMITVSTLSMFIISYWNSYAWAHVTYSEERVYMALTMGSVMAIIMLGFMWGMMYKNRTVNIAIIVGALVFGGVMTALSRSQVLVDDNTYMMGMIPHHSIAILTSERADIDDVRVRELADEIIAAQRREIDEMKWLLDDIDENGEATTEAEADERPMPEFEGSP